MAVLSTQNRQRIWRGLMRFWSAQAEVFGAMTKDDLQAAVNAADDWLDANATSFNTALPTAFRTTATTGQKAFLLAVVALARGNVGLVRSILGEVD